MGRGCVLGGCYGHLTGRDQGHSASCVQRTAPHDKESAGPSSKSQRARKLAPDWPCPPVRTPAQSSGLWPDGLALRRPILSSQEGMTAIPPELPQHPALSILLNLPASEKTEAS